jgi:F0F1-type ATP synthase delta subunit
MKLTENQKIKLIEAVATKHRVSEGFVSALYKYILSKKLQKDPEMIQIAQRLDKVTQQAKNTFDAKIKSGELKNTPELQKLRKTMGLE